MRVLIALPVLNEEKVLETTVRELRRFSDASLAAHDVVIVISDNGSEDRTGHIGRSLAASLPGVRYLRLAQRGKGLAVREAWKSLDADTYVFMDVDLAVDLSALPPLIASVEAGADVAVGSRYHRDSRVRRSFLRGLLSRGYRAVAAVALDTSVSDMPCGFKAVSARTMRDIVPAVADDRWFFDTELVVRAERAGCRIGEVPVTWRELKPAGRQSKVRIVSLVREYLRRVWSLRKTLGPRRPSVIGQLLTGVTRGEWRLVGMAAGIAALLGLVGPLAAVVAARRAGVVWTGRGIFAPGDMTVYLSYVTQAASGRMLLENMATAERLVPVPNLLWSFVGALSRMLGLSAVTAFHAARTLLIFPFAAAAYLACAYVFRSRPHRAIGFLTFMFASGIGLYAAPLLEIAPVGSGDYQWPTDFWVAESNAFMTMLYSPHFVASFALIVVAALLLLMALDAEKPSYGAWAGLAALALFQFHPFHAPTLYLLAAAALLARTWTSGFRPRQWYAVCLFVLIPFPAVAYYFWLTHWSANAAFMLGNNVTTTPHLVHVLLGLGCAVPLAVAGWLREKRGGPALLAPAHRQFFAVWAVTQFALLYSGLNFERRLMEGLQFPLVILATCAIAAFVDWARRGGAVRYLWAGLAGIALLLPSTFATVSRSVAAANTDGPRAEMFFMSNDEAAAYAWIRAHVPPDAVILSSFMTGNTLIGWADRRAYVGHWANTMDVGRKIAESAAFFSASADGARAAFAAEHGITHVVVGPAERAGAGAPLLSAHFARVFSSGAFDVYAFRP